MMNLDTIHSYESNSACEFHNPVKVLDVFETELYSLNGRPTISSPEIIAFKKEAESMDFAGKDRKKFQELCVKKGLDNPWDKDKESSQYFVLSGLRNPSFVIRVKDSEKNTEFKLTPIGGVAGFYHMQESEKENGKRVVKRDSLAFIDGPTIEYLLDNERNPLFVSEKVVVEQNDKDFSTKLIGRKDLVSGRSVDYGNATKLEGQKKMNQEKKTAEKKSDVENVYVRQGAFKRAQNTFGATVGYFMEGYKDPLGEYHTISLPFSQDDGRVTASLVKSGTMKGWLKVEIQKGGALEMSSKDGVMTMDVSAFKQFVEAKNRKVVREISMQKQDDGKGLGDD